MALFEKVDADTKAQRDAEAALRSKRRDRDSLAERLAIAETSITSYRAQARKLAGDGADDKAISIAEGRMRDAQDRVETLTGALADIDVIITGIEREIDQIVDKRCRETSLAVDAMSTRLSKAASAFDEAAKELEAAAREILIIPEAQAVAEFTKSMHVQIPVAVEMIVAGLKGHAHGVRSGHAPASLPRPAAPAPKLAIVPPPPPTLTLIPTKRLKYINADGGVTTCGAYNRHVFPEALGELAVRSNVAVALNDTRAKDFQAAGFATVGTPDEASCAWLGPAGREAPERFAKQGGPPIHSSLTLFTPSGAGPFTVVDRGPPIVGSMPAQPLAVGARKAEEE